MRHNSTAVLAAALAACSIAGAAIPDAWIVFSPERVIYLWNSGTKETRLIIPVQNGRNEYAAFSRDGKRLVSVVDGDGVYIANNDGTGLRKVCATFTSNGRQFCNVCWTDLGIFWTENTRSIYWADPATGQRKELGPLATNTTGNHLRMSRAGTRAYLRTDHNTPPAVGGLFFEVTSSVALTNERPFANPLWDHGSAMLNDGSAAVWIAWECNSYGRFTGCVGHHFFALRDFVDMNKYTIVLPNDGLDPATYELAGPGNGPCTTPSSDDHIIYKQSYKPDCWANPRYFIEDIKTRETRDVTPLEVAPGSPIASLARAPWCGEFWFGALPNPHDTAPYIALNKAQVRLNNQATATPADTVTVSNGGTGTLGTVSVSESPSAAWVTVQVAGSGNSQRLVVQANAAGLAAGDYTTTVTVSASGAANTPSFTVTLSVGAQILAPSNLAAYYNPATSSVALSWSDNSNNETGFVVQRSTGAGTFGQIRTVGAGVTQCNDSNVILGTTYSYRVRATNGTLNSTYSDTATVDVPLPPIVVTGPLGGAAWYTGLQAHVTWTAPLMQVVQIDITVDGGDTWQTITATGGISQASPSWGDYVWTVPASIGVQPSVRIRVAQYGNPTIAGLSGAFSISSAPSSTSRAHQRSDASPMLSVRRTQATITVACRLPDSRGGRVVVHDLMGRIVAVYEMSGSVQPGTVEWRVQPAAGTTYVVRLEAAAPGGRMEALASVVCQAIR